MSKEDLVNLLTRHTHDLTQVRQVDGKSHYTCHVDGEEEYNAFIMDLNALGFSFYTRSAKSNDSSRALFSYTKKESDLQIPFFGSPFQIIKSSYMYCSMDGNYKPSSRQYLSDDQPSLKRSRFSAQPTKKVGCPASMRVKVLRIYDDETYLLAAPYKRHSRNKNKILSQLAKDLASETPPAGLLRYKIVLSSAEDHNHSVVSTNHNQRLHPRLKDEIYALVRSSPDVPTKAVRAHLREVVRGMFEVRDGPHPDPENRCYYPIDHVIRFHMYQAHVTLNENGYDQDTLAKFVQTWIREYPEDDFYFRPRAVDGTDRKSKAAQLKEDLDGTLLFCHQTRWQRHMLRRYGNDITLLDAAYRTCKYGFPLYFLVVKTNSSDCVVGTFVVQREATVFIAEALNHFRSWNPEWHPEFFLADFNDEEVDALKQVFPQATVYISTFHRELAWDRFLNKKGNVSKKAATSIRRVWHAIASSRSEEEYTQNLQEMYDCAVYQDSALAQTYFFTNWLPLHQKWVEAYQRKDFVCKININNGTDCQRSLLQHTFLTDSPEKTLSGVIKLVVENFLPDLLEKYSHSNIPTDYREYTDTVPEFLKDRPIPFIESVMLRYEEAKEYDASLINDMGEGLFIVRSGMNVEQWCSVDFLEVTCSCFDFSKWRIPCKHMCAIFQLTEWVFDRLPAWYRGHPYVTTDLEYASEVGIKIDFDESTLEGVVAEEEQTAIEVDVDVDMDVGVVDPHDEETIEEDDKLQMVQKIDIDKLMENTRDKLLTIVGYTYMKHEPEVALRFANSVLALDVEMTSVKIDEESFPTESSHSLAEAHEIYPTPNDSTVSKVSRYDKKPLAVKAAAVPTKQKVLDIIKKVNKETSRRSFPRLKIGKKHIGQCDVPAHQWREYVMEKVDVYPPQTMDQIVVIDVNHIEKSST